MGEVCKEKILNIKKMPNIKISKLREGERFNEFLITKEEIPFCQDMGKMYKISRKISNKTKVSEVGFSSGTAPQITNKKLKKIILELFKKYNFKS